jgi:uncharacterized protein YcbK (DUF882 family)
MAALSEHFYRHEFACGCGCGFDTVDAELIDILEDVRNHFALPIRITSAARCASHNFDVGGAKSSQHKLGRAADIVIEGVDAGDVYEYINATYPHNYGMGKYLTFTHIDTRGTKARW